METFVAFVGAALCIGLLVVSCGPSVPVLPMHVQTMDAACAANGGVDSYNLYGPNSRTQSMFVLCKNTARFDFNMEVGK